MPFGSIQNLGRDLALARRLGETRGLRLDRITSEDEALAVQDEAIAGRHSSPQGHRVAATTSLTQRLLGCPEPVTAPLLAADLLRSGDSLRLPAGVIGAGCEFAFMIARPFPLGGEDCSGTAVESAVAACRLGIGVLGRRVPASLPLNVYTASADFGLGVAYVDGPEVADWRSVDLAAAVVSARLDGSVLASGRGGDVQGHPLEAVAWLARALARRGRLLNPGDLVTTGSCTGLLQVLPGQTFTADFGPLGSVELRLD